MKYGTKKEIENLINNIDGEIKDRFMVERIKPVKNTNPKNLTDFLNHILSGKIKSMEAAKDSVSKNILNDYNLMLEYPTKKNNNNIN